MAPAPAAMSDSTGANNHQTQQATVQCKDRGQLPDHLSNIDLGRIAATTQLLPILPLHLNGSFTRVNTSDLADIRPSTMVRN